MIVRAHPLFYLAFPGHRTFDCIAFPSGFLPPTFIKQKWRSRLYSYGLLTRFYARMMHMYRFISDYHVMQVKHVDRCLALHSPPLSRETLRDQFLALQDRFWPCKINFWACKIVFGLSRSISGFARSFLALQGQFLALRNRFCPCEINFWLCKIVFSLARSIFGRARSFLVLRDQCLALRDV